MSGNKNIFIQAMSLVVRIVYLCIRMLGLPGRETI